MNLYFKKLNNDAKNPVYAYEDDAGFDLFSVEAINIKAGEIVQIHTGLSFEIPKGCVGLIWDKSGLSQKFGLKTLGGVIDSGYRGEVLIGIINLSKTDFNLEKGQKVAQMIIQKKEYCEIIERGDLSETERGSGAFGSSGK